jgi:hypothetical protein
VSDPLPPQVEAALALAREGRLYPSLILHGGTMEARLASAEALARALLCEAEAALSPCGQCRACRRIAVADAETTLFHPDVAVLRRDLKTSTSVDATRELLRMTHQSPFEARGQVLVIAEAESLTPEAANALLKQLEEPPADTWIVLTATEPERVLPTIRSRAVALRLARLPDAEVRQFARAAFRPEPGADELERLVRRADGIIGRLVGGAESAGKAALEARSLLEALGSGPGARFERGIRQLPWQARGGFTDLLDALAEELADRARGAPDRDTAAPFAAALERVQAARADAQGNLNPQLLLTHLAGELGEVL